MKGLIYKTSIFFFTGIFLIVIYLSFIGIETKRFNDQIINQIKNVNQDLEIELKKIKLVLDPFNLSIKAKTLGSKLKLKEGIVETEIIESQISLKSILNKEFSILDLQISTKSLNIKKLISFIRGINSSTELLILENFIKKGYLIADIKIEFDDNGNIKNNFNIRGFVKEAKINFFKKYDFDKLNFVFEINQQGANFEEIKLSYNKLDLNFEKIFIKNDKKHFFINGEFQNKNLILSEKDINRFFHFDDFVVKKMNLNSKNNFFLKINDKFRLKDFKLNSEALINELVLLTNYKLDSFLPKVRKEIKLSNHNLQIIYDKDKLSIVGDGNVMLQNSNDIIDYKIFRNDKIFKFESSLEITKNPFLISFLNFENHKKKNIKINLRGKVDENDNIEIDKIFLKDELNNIKIENIIFNKDFKIVSLKKAQFDYFDVENIKNNFQIIHKDKKFYLEGKFFNANNLIDVLLNKENNENSLPFKNQFRLNVNLEKVQLDRDSLVKNFKGYLVFKNQNLSQANLSGSFLDRGEIKLTINSINNDKTTTLYSDQAKPFINKYKFIKGFQGGSLDFYSNSVNKETISTLKIYDFKLNELPVLTKLLTLASLQGIADLLKGEGIGFNEFEMNFNTKDSLMTINEIYAIGPAISILMDGYVEKKQLISLRGTLVPATTLNKVIGSIPFLGNILVGTKTGEGVFGVSFKIKGPPKKLETSVNPIKTLTPRFITRTLEKIKKSN